MELKKHCPSGSGQLGARTAGIGPEVRAYFGPFVVGHNGAQRLPPAMGAMHVASHKLTLHVPAMLGLSQIGGCCLLQPQCCIQLPPGEQFCI